MSEFTASPQADEMEDSAKEPAGTHTINSNTKRAATEIWYYRNVADGSVKHDIPRSSGLMCHGCIIIPLALLLLAWNEKNNVCQSMVYLKIEEQSVVVDCTPSAADDVDGKITFMSCPVQADYLPTMTPLTSFNMPGLQESIKIPSIAAAQRVEMYQCIESVGTEIDFSGNLPASVLELHHSDSHTPSVQEEGFRTSKGIVRKTRQKPHGARDARLLPESLEEDNVVNHGTFPNAHTNYLYRMDWAEVWYDSREFMNTPQYIHRAGCPGIFVNGTVHNNPPLPDRGDGQPVQLGKQVVHVSSVSAGPFTFIDEGAIGNVTADVPVAMAPFAGEFAHPSNTDGSVTSISRDAVSVYPELPHYVSTCKSDRIGCIRISYNRSNLSHISVLGRTHSGGILSSFRIGSARGCAQEEHFIRMWPRAMTKEEAIEELKQEADDQSWALRVVGLLLLWVGFHLVFDLIANADDAVDAVLDWVPLADIIQSALEGVRPTLLCILSLSISCSCGLLLMAIIWLRVRPVNGGPFLVGAMMLMVLACCMLGYTTRTHNLRQAKLYMSQQDVMKLITSASVDHEAVKAAVEQHRSEDR